MKQDHIIQKVFVEITVNNKEKAFSIKDDITSFLSLDVFPKIEKYINDLEYKLYDTDYTIQIPTLELNLDVKSSSLNTELTNEIAYLFKEKLSEIITPVVNSEQKTQNGSEAYLIDNQEKMIQTFIYFLEKGSMPWWNSDKKNISVLEPTAFNSLILGSNFTKSMLPVLSKQNALERMINQLSDGQIAQLCMVISKEKDLKINLETEVIHHISKMSPNDRKFVWSWVIKVLSRFSNSAITEIQEYLVQEIVNIIGLSQIKTNNRNWKTVIKIFHFIKENEIFESIKNSKEVYSEKTAALIEKPFQEKDKAIHEDFNFNKNDEYYINNAGLILIHPFIKTFFEHCDLLHPETQQLINPEVCVHLLHYIATGKTNAPECDMIFEKFLCNIPVDQSINRHIKLSRKHKKQAKNLIESVQYNWSPMKNSSVALLQNEFFQRPGKLVIHDSDHTLTVERKTQDILLDRLSWGMSLVKLPWKEKFIFVNW